MLADPKNTGFGQIDILYRCWKLLVSLHKSKCSTAIDRFVPVFELKSS